MAAAANPAPRPARKRGFRLRAMRILRFGVAGSKQQIPFGNDRKKSNGKANSIAGTKATDRSRSFARCFQTLLDAMRRGSGYS
jgi:hypothetical protein